MTFLIIIIILVLLFDFINGFHDSANSIATVVSTKVLSPIAAVGLAATFNFLAFLIFPLKVATTIGKGVINPEIITLEFNCCSCDSCYHLESYYMVDGFTIKFIAYSGRRILLELLLQDTDLDQ